MRFRLRKSHCKMRPHSSQWTPNFMLKSHQKSIRNTSSFFVKKRLFFDPSGNQILKNSYPRVTRDSRRYPSPPTPIPRTSPTPGGVGEPRRPLWHPRTVQRAVPKALHFLIEFPKPFWFHFGSPKWVPKASQNVKKPTKCEPKREKDDFLKMSTSLTRDAHFRGSRVLKTPPKSAKNATRVPQKPHRFLH